MHFPIRCFMSDNHLGLRAAVSFWSCAVDASVDRCRRVVVYAGDRRGTTRRIESVRVVEEHSRMMLAPLCRISLGPHHCHNQEVKITA
jgi:hypothetical protein